MDINPRLLKLLNAEIAPRNRSIGINNAVRRYFTQVSQEPPCVSRRKSPIFGIRKECDGAEKSIIYKSRAFFLNLLFTQGTDGTQENQIRKIVVIKIKKCYNPKRPG